MKKLLTLILALLLLLLCSCGVQKEPVIEEPQSEEEEIEIFKSDEGKFGLARGEEILAEPVYDSIEPAKGNDAAFYNYKAFVSEGTGLFLEEGGKHLYSVLEKPVERFYLLDSEGKPIVDIAFEEVELSFLLDENENLIPYYLNGLSEGSFTLIESAEIPAGGQKISIYFYVTFSRAATEALSGQEFTIGSINFMAI